MLCLVNVVVQRKISHKGGAVQIPQNALGLESAHAAVPTEKSKMHQKALSAYLLPHKLKDVSGGA